MANVRCTSRLGVCTSPRTAPGHACHGHLAASAKSPSPASQTPLPAIASKGRVGRMPQRLRRFPLHSLRKAASPGRGLAKSDVAAAVCTVPSAQCHPDRGGRGLRAEGAATTLGLRRRDDAAASTACGRRGRHGDLQEVLGGGHHGDGLRHAASPQLVRVWCEGQRSVGPVPRHSSRPARPHDEPRVPSTPCDTRGGT